MPHAANGGIIPSAFYTTQTAARTQNCSNIYIYEIKKERREKRVFNIKERVFFYMLYCCCVSKGRDDIALRESSPKISALSPSSRVSYSTRDCINNTGLYISHAHCAKISVYVYIYMCTLCSYYIFILCLICKWNYRRDGIKFDAFVQ